MSTTATVAVLFCDVVGSTDRLTRMGDEAGDEFRRRLFADLRRAVVEHGGVEVKNLGDGLMVVFEHSTVDALRCAAALHAAAAAVDTSDPVHLRVGISVGEVAHEDDDWFGTPVVEAARLCAVAAADQTLAPALLESLVGSRGRVHRFRPIGPVQLKGLAAPIEVVEVDGSPSTEPAPIPSAPAPATGRARRRLTLGAVAIGVLVVGATVAALLARSDDEAAAPTTAEPGVVSDVVSRAEGYTPTYASTPCPQSTAGSVPDATCGELVVPESRADPTGRQLHLPVVKVPGPPHGRSRPVVVLDVNEPASTALRDSADVYLLSLRGFGGGSDVPLTCPEVQAAWTASFRLRAEDPGAIERRVAAAAACAARLRGSGVRLEGYSMVEASDDLRDLVAALHLGKVTVASGGFTTTAAVAWARANPGSVESLLFTNPTPPGSSTLADPATSTSRSFERIVELCARDRGCAAAYPDLEAAHHTRYVALADRPVAVSTTTLGGIGPFDVLLDGRRYGAALETAMRESARLGLVPSAVSGASDELTAAAGIDEDVTFYAGPAASTAAFLSITCSYDARLNRTAQVSDATLAEFAGANEPTFVRMCGAWGVPSVYDRLARPLDLDVPVLLASGGIATSGVNGWADAMAGGLPRATVVDVPTMTEDLAFAPPPCLRELRAAFLADPGARLDGSACRKHPPRIDFVAPS